MNKKQQKLKRMQTLNDEMRGLLENAEKAGANGKPVGMTKENRALYDNKEKEYNTLKGEVEVIIKQENRDATMSKFGKPANVNISDLSTQGALSESEQRDLNTYDFSKVFKGVSRLDGIEAELHQEGERESRGLNVNGAAVMLPNKALKYLALRSMGRRSLSVNGTDGNTAIGVVQTDIYQTIFEIYRERLLLPLLGATSWDGLTGNMSIPVQTTQGGEVKTKTETGSAEKLEPTTANLVLSPKRIPAQTEITNQLVIQQSAQTQAWAVSNLMKSVMGKFQRLVFSGDPTTTPTDIRGIVNTTGVKVVDITGGKLTRQALLQMAGVLEGDEIDLSAFAFVIDGLTNSWGLTMPALPNSSKTLISEDIDANGLRSIAGYRAGITNALPTTDGKHTVIAGCFNDLVMANWGAIGMIVDPYTKAGDGSSIITAEAFMDAGVIRPYSFSKIEGIDLSAA